MPVKAVTSFDFLLFIYLKKYINANKPRLTWRSFIRVQDALADNSAAAW